MELPPMIVYAYMHNNTTTTCYSTDQQPLLYKQNIERELFVMHLVNTI